MPQVASGRKEVKLSNPKAAAPSTQAEHQNDLVAPMAEGDQKMHPHHAGQDAVTGVNSEPVGLGHRQGQYFPAIRRQEEGLNGQKKDGGAQKGEKGQGLPVAGQKFQGGPQGASGHGGGRPGPRMWGSMPQAPQRVIATTTRVTTPKSLWMVWGSNVGNKHPG